MPATVANIYERDMDTKDGMRSSEYFTVHASQIGFCRIINHSTVEARTIV